MANVNVAEVLPMDLLDFLNEHGKKKFAFDPRLYSQMEVDCVTLLPPQMLHFATFAVSTWEFYNNYGEQGKDPELTYSVEGVDLVADCGNSYAADGVLVWFPKFQEYGYWDSDHHLIGLFPKANWITVSGKLPLYINAQWDNSLVRCSLLRPWADKRCTDIVGEQRPAPPPTGR